MGHRPSGKSDGFAQLRNVAALRELEVGALKRRRSRGSKSRPNPNRRHPQTVGLAGAQEGRRRDSGQVQGYEGPLIPDPKPPDPARVFLRRAPGESLVALARVPEESGRRGPSQTN